MESRSKKITARVTPGELETIREKASDHGLTISTYCRDIALNYPIRCIVDQKAIKALLDISGDMGRLGGLFKHWLTKTEDVKIDLTSKRSYKDIEFLVEDIIATQKKLKAKIIELDGKV